MLGRARIKRAKPADHASRLAGMMREPFLSEQELRSLKLADPELHGGSFSLTVYPFRLGIGFLTS